MADRETGVCGTEWRPVPDTLRESAEGVAVEQGLCNAEHPDKPGVYCERKICVVPVTQGFSAYIDEQDAELVLASSWSVVRTKYNVYAKAKRAGRYVLMHRLIMGEPVGLDVDHLNHNGLDNRRQNLRVGTRSQNNANGRPRKDGRSRFKGVSWHAHASRWQVHISKDGVRKNLGLFKDELEAARVYDLAALEVHAEFALTNEMLGLYEEGG